MTTIIGGAQVPERPRLGSHVLARRHIVAGEARIHLHDEDRTLVLGEREWRVLREADGTRDLEGIRIAAGRAGTPTRAEHLAGFFHELARLGLLEQRPEPDAEPELARDLPIHALPGYRFRCDGQGACCRQYDTILFAPLEVARARVTLPMVGGHEPESVFLPEHGTRAHLCVATHVDGSCIYSDTDRRCRLHAAGGPEAKPMGCRVFPVRLVDVGDAIRAAPRPECACVFASGRSDDGEALVDARRGSELPPEVLVARLPERVSMGPDEVSPAELVGFFDGVPLDAPDLAAFAWGLATEVRSRGRAASGVARVDAAEVREALGALSESAARLEARGTAWRAPEDVVRRGVGWVREALGRLERGALPGPIEPADEVLYLRAAFFLTLGAGSNVETELRARALALWVARAFPSEARAVREAAHPLAIVEALSSGHGLDLSGA